MTNFSPKLEDHSDEQLKGNVNSYQPNFASLSSDELTRRSLEKLRMTMVDLDHSNKKFTLSLGYFAIIQIVIAGLSLILQIYSTTDRILTFFVGVLFLASIYFILIKIESIK